MLSTDAGATWKELGFFAEKGPVGIIDEKTLLTAKGKTLQRSADGGATWTKVVDLPAGSKTPMNPVIYYVKGVCYLMTEQGVDGEQGQGGSLGRCRDLR